MGLDLTLLPHKHHHLSGVPFLCESLRLDRAYALFDLILTAPRHFPGGPVEIHSDTGWDKCTANPYGEPIYYVKAGDLAAAIPAALSTSPWNAAVIAFVRTLPADVPVYLWWH